MQSGEVRFVRDGVFCTCHRISEEMEAVSFLSKWIEDPVQS